MDKRLISALHCIPPANLSYDEWLHMGMACHEAGLPCEVWDEWSKNDGRRYHHGECAEKWATFGDGSNGKKITAATIYKMAKSYGWKPSTGHPLEFDDVIEYDGEEQNIGESRSNTNELIKYLETLFQPTEYVSFVYKSYLAPDGKWKPGQRCCGFTAGQLIESLKKYPLDICATIYDYNTEAGTWISPNPVDGGGGKDCNVTDYRYVLVESDNLSVPQQEELYRQQRLPIKAMTYSGGKSIHAVICIDAGSDKEEYEKRVQYLFSFLAKHGCEVDIQNKNPSRLSRMPGVDRGDRHQALLGTNIGCKSWEEWVNFVEGKTLPPIITLNDYLEELPSLQPVQIEGILRRGHKFLISGPSKAGKSFLLMELCVCIACGLPWLGHQCTKGFVLYIDLEIDQNSAINRFAAICDKMGVKWEEFAKNFVLWPLRGKGKPLEQLVPDLLEKVEELGRPLDAIVIDPIYKVIMGDENNATEMGRFCNQLDRIAASLNCSVIYCHHHSKGMQGMKKAMDRASGSGVFARDPDALLDMSPIVLSEEVENFYQENNAPAFRCETILREFPAIPPFDIWFEYPLHRVDISGILAACPVEGAPKFGKAGRSGSKKEDPVGAVFGGFAKRVDPDTGRAKMSDVAKDIQKSDKTLKRYIDDECAAYFYRKKDGYMYQRSPEDVRKILDEGVAPEDL